MKSIAILGCSKDRSKFGNICLRAYKEEGYNVFPVNPKEEEIEGEKCYKSIVDIGVNIDIVSVYLRKDILIREVENIIGKKPNEVFLNPGTEDENIAKRLRESGIEVREECSIRAIGRSPTEFI